MRPWLTVWLKPGATIARVLAEQPGRGIFLLAVLGGIASVFVQIVAVGMTTEVLDWRAAAVLVLVGALYGFIALYLHALCYRWSGRMLGGGATQAQLRTLVAWTFLPYIAGLAVSLVLLSWQKASGGTAFDPEVLVTLLSIIALAFALWSIVMTLLMLSRAQRFGFWRTIAAGAIGTAISAGLVGTFSVAERTFLFQPFNVPSGSLKPTLIVGDHFFVAKYSYGYSHYSLPFSPPLFSGRIFAAEPKRGDILVFRLPKDPSTDYIKRLIGLPGDRIQMINGLLHINGAPVKRERIADYIDTDDRGKPVAVKQWRETLPNGVSHSTLDSTDNGFYDNTPVYNVPPGHYFMMGDNRDNSLDSRARSQIGYVPFENLIGRVERIYYSAAPRSGFEPAIIRYDRVGMAVR